MLPMQFCAPLKKLARLMISAGLIIAASITLIEVRGEDIPKVEHKRARGKAASAAAAKTMIKQLHEQANVALSRGDLDGVMSAYSNDIVSMPPNQPALVGKSAVRDMWADVLSKFSIESSVVTEEVEVAGDWAFERGTYQMTLKPKDGGAPIRDDGKYLDILRRQQNGAWKYARVSWSSSKSQR